MINGAKTFITNGHHADLVCVAAKTDADATRQGRVAAGGRDGGPAGLPARARCWRRSASTGWTPRSFSSTTCACRPSNLLGGEEGQGFRQLMQQLPRERLLIAVGAAATMQRAVDETLAYVARAQGVRRAAAGDAEHALQAGRVRDRGGARAGVRRRLHRAPARRHARRADRRDGQVVDHRQAVPRDRRMPATARRLRLHDRVPDRAHVRRRARAAHLRRRERGDERADRARDGGSDAA